MDIHGAIQIMRSYPYMDIDGESGTVRKQLPSNELTLDLLRGYLSTYGTVTLVPKKLMGTSPVRQAQEAITLDVSQLTRGNGGLSGFDNHTTSTHASNHSELYRIMYENAKEEARDYKRKYEDAIADKHKAELELAGSKNSVIGDIAQGLSGFAPMLMGTMGGNTPVGVGETPATQQQANIKPITDVRLQAVIKSFLSLNEPAKQDFYSKILVAYQEVAEIQQI